MRLSNIEMERRLQSLKPLLERADLIGYAAARNHRMLAQQLVEYDMRKTELIKKYGHQDGPNYSLMPDDPNYMVMVGELEKFAFVEHDVELMTRPMSEAIGKLTGQQIVDVWWMLEDDEEARDGAA